VRHWLAFAACVVVGLTNEVGGAVLSLSLQDAGAELHASSAEMQVVMTLSKLLFGAFMLLGGVLGDARGRRRVLVIGAGVIVASSLLASASGSVGQLALARGLDGLGNAAVGPLALALVPRVRVVGSVAWLIPCSICRSSAAGRSAPRSCAGPSWPSRWAAPSFRSCTSSSGYRVSRLSRPLSRSKTPSTCPT
jgi:MFS family permease